MKCWPRWIAGLTLAVLVLFPAPARADRGGYVIERFHTELEIHDNAEMTVTERLEVDFSESRHGIYRAIPIRYTDRLGYAYSLGFHLLDVTDENGNRHGVKVSHQGRRVNIRIGDADRTVRGRVVYIIRYRIRDGLSHFADHDEVYWNATGNDWQALIRRASASVILPAALPADSLEANGYTGRFGDSAQDVDVTYPEPGMATFTALSPLDPLEGLTVSLAWPRGYVTFPGKPERTLRFLAANWIIVAPFVLFGWLWRRYKHHGQDPPGAAAVMVQYEPPKGMTPGEVGVLVDERVDLRDITAVVVDLAVRGYHRILAEKNSAFFGLINKDETVFERTEKPDDDLLPHEHTVLHGIFASGDRVPAADLKEEFYTRIPKVESALYQRLTETGYFAGNPQSIKRKYQLGGVVAGLIVFALGMATAKAVGGIFPLAAIVPAFAGFLTLAAFISMAPAMPRRTRDGVRMRGWALGFEEFVSRVERDKLEADQAKNVFETLLPYAMALGVATTWAKQFEGIYSAPGAGPAWYVGHDPTSGFSTRGFEQSLSSSMSDVGKQMAASPRSSGSGGGGFSGGGGGGGGGGSW